MSISTLENFGSVRALDAMHAEEDERARNVAHFRAEFLSAAARCDASSIAGFAGTTTDFKNRLPGGGYGRRLQTVGELVHDAVDNTPFRQRAMQILLNAAAGHGTQRDAQQLLEELASAWAEEQVS